MSGCRAERAPPPDLPPWRVSATQVGRGRACSRGADQGVVGLSLEREPKESILRAFDLTVIRRTFPAYEREIGGRL